MSTDIYIDRKMGIQGLRKFLKTNCPGAIEEMEIIEGLRGKRVGIDMSIYMYRMKSQGRIGRGFEGLLKILQSADARAIFVMDGAADEAKSKCLKERKERKTAGIDALREKKEELEALKGEEPTENVIEMKVHQAKLKEKVREIKKLERTIVSLTREDFVLIKDMVRTQGFELRQAPAEADILLGQMSRAGEIDLVMSEDMDMLCHGCECVLRLGEGSWDRVEVYRLADVLSGLGVSLRGFVQFCILCGCDQCSRIKGVGPVKAMNMVRAIGDDLGAIEIAFRTAWEKYSPVEEFDEWMGEFRGALEIFLE